jgi:hypothetical protein
VALTPTSSRSTSGAPDSATFITQTPDATLTAEQAMSVLATGIVKNTTGTGVQSIATQGTDYYAPGGTDVAVADGGTGSSTASGAATNLGLGTGDSPQFTAVNVGHATDTTVARVSAGVISVEGNTIYAAGGTDVPVADGGTGASTASGARTNLAVIQGTTGTSMPGSPATNDIVWRTDLGIQFYYDGTRWLSHLLATPFPAVINTGGQVFTSQLCTPSFDYDIYVEKVILTTYVATTNSGVSYWSFAAYKSDTAAAATQIGSTVNTSADSANTRLRKTITVGAILGGSATYPLLYVTNTKTGTPGNVDFTPVLVYRLIGT